MKPRTRRALWILAGLAALGVATTLVLNAFRSNMVFFFTPSQVAGNEAPRDRAFRVGGLVEAGSVVRDKDALTVRFNVTDTARTIPVVYTGILPDLFREGQGVVTEGALDASGHFKADSVLAKHDETYMPKEVADALKKQGHWKSDGGYGLAGTSNGAKK